MTRTELQSNTRHLHTAQARAAAEAGIWLAIEDILKKPAERRWPLNRSIDSIPFGDGEFRLRIDDEAGKIDLNSARPAMLTGLFRSAGLSDRGSEALTAAVLDWRDRDGTARPSGAEDPFYRALNLPYEAKDGPFNSVEELRLVAGMTEPLYQQVHQALTVHSHLPGLNPQFASRDVLYALPGQESAAIDQYLDARVVTASSQIEGVDKRYVSRSSGGTFRIRSEGRVGKTTATVEIIVIPKRSGQQPYTLLSWRTGLRVASVDKEPS